MNLTDDQHAELRDEIAGTTVGSGYYQMSIAVDEADQIVDYIAPLIERFIRDAQAAAWEQGWMAAGLSELEGAPIPNPYRGHQ